MLKCTFFSLDSTISDFNYFDAFLSMGDLKPVKNSDKEWEKMTIKREKKLDK